MSASSDRNLLFGLLALHLDFLTREQLLDGMNAWLLRKADPLGKLLEERGALSQEDRRAVEVLVERHLARHGGEVPRSLAAVPVQPEVRGELESVADAEVQASVASLAPPTIGEAGPPASA